MAPKLLWALNEKTLAQRNFYCNTVGRYKEICGFAKQYLTNILCVKEAIFLIEILENRDCGSVSRKF